MDIENGKAKQSTPSSPQHGFDDCEDQIGEIVDNLTKREGRIQNQWDQIRDLEEQLDFVIQQISHLLHQEYAPPYRTLAEFREYIPAARGSEHRAGRPSLLFSSTPPLLRDSSSRRIYWGPMQLPAEVPAFH